MNVRFCFLVGLTATLAMPSEMGVKRVGPLDPRRILCPVLACLYNAGVLKTDVNGSVTLEEYSRALNKGLMDNLKHTQVQAIGIAMYDYTEKQTELHRNRCSTGSACSISKKLHGVTKKTERWLNLFNMNGKQTVEHGMSTGVRGGATNVPEFDFTGGPCNGEYPCEERFQKFYVPCADKNGRFYKDNVLCVVCAAYEGGDRAGEFSYNRLQGLRQWQMVTAMLGWLEGFGRNHTGTERYFEMVDVRAMIMEAKFPPTWVPRPWGSALDLPYGESVKLPCGDKDGNYPPWWQNTTCPSHTGQTCTPIINPCKGGAYCLTSHQCACPLGPNGVAMCAKNGECVPRNNTCTYFGEPCQMVLADNPSAPF